MKIKYSLKYCLSFKKICQGSRITMRRSRILEVLVGFEVQRITLRVYGTVTTVTSTRVPQDLHPSRVIPTL